MSKDSDKEKERKAKMARRKQEAALQQDVETQEEWEEILSKEGVWVIDVYQEWCGPCASMVSKFRTLKNELGDDLLKFATAKADTIDALDRYKGKCEPTFLFYAGGILVSVIRSSNSPRILRTITEQLAQERKVMDGNAERKEVRDAAVSQSMEKETTDMDDEDMDHDDADEKKKEVTVAIIKPDVVKEGKADEVIKQMEESGIEILKQDERQMTEDECREFYAHMKDEDFFEDLIKYMTSGPCMVLVLSKGRTGENIISEWRECIGPTSVDEARETAPTSLRAKYGSESFMNGIHGSDSTNGAARELAFFFPDYQQPTIPDKPKLQRTLALIRPDAFKEHKDAILDKIEEAGFQIALHREMNLTKDQAEEFYKEHKGQPYFDDLVDRMCGGPLLALGLAREDAIDNWRNMLGPKELSDAKEKEPDSLRAKYTVEGVEINQLHGSDSVENARKEMEFFFPMEQTVAAIKPDAYGTKEEIIERIHESGFKIAARKETVLTKEMAEQFYADVKDKDYYDDLVEHMTSGPTLFMVLSRENAVDGWRAVIGPTDPGSAKDENSESLRALYGKSTVQNAVHGSSDRDQVQKSMENVFGQVLSFNPDGTLSGGIPQEEEQEKQSSNPSSPTPPSPKGSKPGSPTGSKPSSPTPGSAKSGSRAGSAKAGSRAVSAKAEDDKPGSPKEGSSPTPDKEEEKPDSAKPGSRATSPKDEAGPESGKEETKPESAKGGSRPTSGEKPKSPEPESKTDESTTEKTESTEESKTESVTNANTSSSDKSQSDDSKTDDKTESKTDSDKTNDTTTDGSEDKTESKSESEPSKNTTENSENKTPEPDSTKSEKEKSDVKDEKTD